MGAVIGVIGGGVWKALNSQAVTNIREVAKFEILLTELLHYSSSRGYNLLKNVKALQNGNGLSSVKEFSKIIKNLTSFPKFCDKTKSFFNEFKNWSKNSSVSLSVIQGLEMTSFFYDSCEAVQALFPLADQSTMASLKIVKDYASCALNVCIIWQTVYKVWQKENQGIEKIAKTIQLLSDHAVLGSIIGIALFQIQRSGVSNRYEHVVMFLKVMHFYYTTKVNVVK